MPPRPSTLDRFLRLFSEVRPGEGVSAVLLAANVFLILTSYYLVKVLREPLILASGGAEIRSYSAAGQAILLLGAVPLYGRLASRWPRRRLINLVTLFFAACLGGFFLLARMKVPIGIVFFLWVGVFNLMVVAQFWSFANDVYSTDEGQRLFPIVGFGASAGAVVGSFLAGRLIAPLGLYQVMLVAAAVLILSLLLTNLVDARERNRTEAHLPPPDTTAEMPAATTTELRVATTAELRVAELAAQPMNRESPFTMVWRTRYLLLIALMILVLNWVNTTGEYIVSRTVSRAAEAAVAAGTTGGLTASEYIGEFYSAYLSGVNILALVLQLFVVSRVFKYLGVRTAVMILPVIALVGYTVLAFFPILSAVRWAKTAENSTDYSLQNTVRNVLFLPTTRDQKYKAKQVIDSFVVRTGDVLSALLVFVGTSYLAFSTRHFALFNAALVLVWLGLAWAVGREYREKTG